MKQDGKIQKTVLIFYSMINHLLNDVSIGMILSPRNLIKDRRLKSKNFTF